MAGHELSVITVGLHGEQSLRPTLRALAAQTIASKIEIVAVIPAGRVVPNPKGFAAVRTVSLAELTTAGDAIAAGVHAATAPVVAYVEEHSWPQPQWAERLLGAHGVGVDAVSWALENANPGSATSWVRLLTDFGPAVHPSPCRAAWPPPWHHTSYRRELLTSYGLELGDMLEAEWRLHNDLSKAGYRFEHAGNARSRHWNISRYGANLACELRSARSFGAARAADGRWGLWRRLAYAAAAPLICTVRLSRCVTDVRRVGPPRIARVAPLIGVGLAASAVGEACGYASGSGSSPRQTMRVELDRRASLKRSDRERWDRAAAGGAVA